MYLLGVALYFLCLRIKESKYNSTIITIMSRRLESYVFRKKKEKQSVQRKHSSFRQGVVQMTKINLQVSEIHRLIYQNL